MTKNDGSNKYDAHPDTQIAKRMHGSGSARDDYKISSSKQNILEEIIDNVIGNVEKMQTNALRIHDAGNLVKDILSKDPAALDSNLAYDLISSRFGEKAYNTLRIFYQSVLGQDGK